jgi:exopolyphosphatase/guanosine-5'-triphosphate,3'-diphosphate pyrophosphatase
MNIAIVDIGSNAIKYKIFDRNNMELKDYYREPLRLGRDVFTNGYLSDYNCEKLYSLLNRYKDIFEEQGITTTHFIATSALRDANNNTNIIEELKDQGIDVKVISGDIEASLLKNYDFTHETEAIIDIGGGSVEICVKQGDSYIAKSFQLGAVRLLSYSQAEQTEAFKDLGAWLGQFSSIESLVGLGGNLRALMQANEISSEFDTKLFDSYVQKYNSLSNDQLINEFNIPEDRIDIIPNALNIYSYIIKETKAKVISNSFWSISDGLAQKLIREEF